MPVLFQRFTGGSGHRNRAKHERIENRYAWLGATLIDMTDSDSLERAEHADSSADLVAADPLALRPRVSSVVLCAVLGVLMAAGGCGIWWLAVRTATGQQFDDMVLAGFAANMPAWLSADTVLGLPLSSSSVMIGVATVFAVAGLAVALSRRRWWLVGQLVALFAVAYGAAKLLKHVLPREMLVRTEITESGVPLGNTAPSGHTALTLAAVLVLLFAVPRTMRAIVAVVGFAWSLLVSALLIAHGWHRPSDILVAYLLVAAVALASLACTRGSGMDEPGTRVSSVGVQIVSSVLITAGVALGLYAAYVVWQLVPGLEVGAEWAVQPAVAVSLIGIIAAGALIVGLTLALRQITASPLSKLGLIGAPPAPPAA